jgi:hypothetical protein
MVQAQLRKANVKNLSMATVTMTTTNTLPKDPIVMGWVGTGIETLQGFLVFFWVNSSC